MGSDNWPSPFRLLADGNVRIGTSRVGLATVVHEIDTGSSPEEIVLAYDALKLDDVRAVVTFVGHNRLQIDRFLTEYERRAEELKTRIESEYPRLSRDELLARRHAESVHAPAGV